MYYIVLLGEICGLFCSSYFKSAESLFYSQTCGSPRPAINKRKRDLHLAHFRNPDPKETLSVSTGIFVTRSNTSPMRTISLPPRFLLQDVYKTPKNEEELDQEFDLEMEALFAGLKNPTNFELSSRMKWGKWLVHMVLLGHVPASQITNQHARKIPNLKKKREKKKESSLEIYLVNTNLN